MENTPLSQRLQAALTGHGAQRQLADHLRIDASNVSKWVRGKADPEPERWAEIERYLQWEPNTIATFPACKDSKLTAGARIGFAPIGGSFDLVIDTEHGHFKLGNSVEGSRELADIRDEVNALIAAAEERFTPEAGWALMAWEARMGARQWDKLSQLF